MQDRYLIVTIKAAGITVPLWLILVFATGEFSWKLAVIGVLIFAVLWIASVIHAPRKHDIPPSPDKHSSDYW